MDVLFLKDYPEINSNATINFYHKFVYQTDVTSKVNCNYKNVDFNYVNGELCITVKCDCVDEFSAACLASNLKILCKCVMQSIDGAYPFSSTSFSFISSVGLEEEKIEKTEDLIDGFNMHFCKTCFSPVLFCTCLALALTKEEFLNELKVLSLCSSCTEFSSHCSCKYNVTAMYAFYQNLVVNNHVYKRFNEIKRLAYLSSCNVSVCFNCNKYSVMCICDEQYKKIFVK